MLALLQKLLGLPQPPLSVVDILPTSSLGVYVSRR